LFTDNRLMQRERDLAKMYGSLFFGQPYTIPAEYQFVEFRRAFRLNVDSLLRRRRA
jgi:hypothetical protein